MTQFTIIIDGKQFSAEGFVASGVNENNGKAFEVYGVQTMKDANGANVASYLPVKDGKLRQSELDNRKAEYDAKWEAEKARIVASNPSVSPEELDFQESIFRAKPENRILASTLTNGLTATIVDANGEAHEAYFMRESTNRFRTYQPRKQTVTADAEPF
ncbi:MAG: hypothetical protein IH600_02825 [Bacteroidetes bacterium]|nr:hypothetical protein [Bacteroidota bacterium]